MKKILLFTFLLSPLYLIAQSNCSISDEKPIQLLSAEMRRGFPLLKKQKPPIYYLSYTLKNGKENSIYISDQGERASYVQEFSDLKVMARAGSPQLDNTRTLKKKQSDFAVSIQDMPQAISDGKAFTLKVWDATQQAAEQAQRMYGEVQTDVQTASERGDDSHDFVFPPKETYCHTQQFTDFNIQRIKEMLIKVSALTKGKAYVLSSSFSFSQEYGHYYFVDSVGTRLKTPFQYVRLSFKVSGRTPEGLSLSRGRIYDVLEEEKLPTEEQLAEDVKQALEELEQQIKAPEAEPATVPAILKNKAMAVFVHEVLGHRVEGHRQKEDSFGKTFTDKVGQMITSPLITIVDDATLPFFKGEPLRGFYEYDSEGVKARPVTLVENGILKNFLMSSSPIKGFAQSNGHGRAEFEKRPVARMGNTRVIASQTISYEELEKKLLEEIKKQGKPYGVIIEDLSGGFTITDTLAPQSFKLEPTYIMRLYPDGRKELVRGVDMVGTPLVSFKEIIAAADDDAVFNGTCGAESGWVPVSSIAPSVLLRSLELEKTQKTNKKLPILPPPMSEVTK